MVLVSGCASPTVGKLPRPGPQPIVADLAAAPEIAQARVATLGFSDVDEPAPVPARSIQPVSGQIGATLPEPGRHETPGNVEAGSWTLAHALNQSLLTNPDLVALRGQINVNKAMVGVAQTYPWNPFIQAQFLPQGRPFVPNTPGMPGSQAGQSNYYVWVMQRFELAHQRRHRISSAMAAMDQVQWNIFQGELLNVAQTARLYFAALYQKDIRQLAEETAELNERLTSVVERRFKANLAKAGDVMTAKVAARQARRQAELAETTYQAALLMLRQQMNLPMTGPFAFTEKLSDIQWLHVGSAEGPATDPCHLAAELVEGRPDVLAAQAGVKVSTANFKLARAGIMPDLQAGPIYETADDGTRYLGVRFQVNVPVFDNGTPLTRQRRAEMNQQELTYSQLKIRAALEAQAAIDQYERVLELVAKARPVRVDALSPELKEITSLFEAGQADILAVLTTQGNLLQERRIYLDLLNQLAQSAAAVVQATGLPPDRVVLNSGK